MIARNALLVFVAVYLRHRKMHRTFHKTAQSYGFLFLMQKNVEFFYVLGQIKCVSSYLPVNQDDQSRQ